MLKYNIEQQIAQAKIRLAAVTQALEEIAGWPRISPPHMWERSWTPEFADFHNMGAVDVINLWKEVKAHKAECQRVNNAPETLKFFELQAREGAIHKELVELEACLATYQKLSNRFED